MRGFSAVGLVRPKYPGNVGGAMRAAYVHNASLVLIERDRSANNRIIRDAMDTPNTWKQVPVIRTEDLFDSLPHGCVPVCVELAPEARNLYDFVHPERALYIFGPEDGSLGDRHLGRAVHTIYVPTRTCMNLAATVNVVLYDRAMKEHQRTTRLSRPRGVSLPSEAGKLAGQAEVETAPG